MGHQRTSGGFPVPHLWLLVAFALGLGLVMARRVGAAPSTPTNIRIVFFEGVFAGGVIELEWEAAAEFNTAGYELWRAVSVAMPPQDNDENTIDPAFSRISVRVNGQGNPVTFIPKGPNELGNDYYVIDANVTQGQSYWYVLVERELNNRIIYHDLPNEMLQVWALVGTPTPTPVPVGGGGNATPTRTRTPAPTASPTPVSTAAGATPSPTGMPTATASPSASPVLVTATPAGGVGRTPTPLATAPTGGGAVASPPPGGGESPPGSDGTAIAQVTSTPEAYPVVVPDSGQDSDPATGSEGAPGADDNSAPATDDAYPGLQPGAGPIGAATATPYPIGSIGQPGPGATDSLTLGGSTSSALAGQGQTSERTSGGSLLILWVGFTAALLIFAAGLFGSIILFTRQRRP